MLVLRRNAQQNISIHALREEGDRERDSAPYSLWVFLSTPSARRATLLGYTKIAGITISIHALREEGDMLAVAYLKFR